MSTRRHSVAVLPSRQLGLACNKVSIVPAGVDVNLSRIFGKARDTE